MSQPVASDEYAVFDFSEFTEEDFQQIDADVALKFIKSGGPSVHIGLEPSPTSLAGSLDSPSSTANIDLHRNKWTPYQEFRPGGVLSVTDLASPAWCEVQFDYGLRQKRSRPIATRPATFLSAQGKEISVEKKIAAKNDKVTKQGRAIHKVLEREMQLEELKVDISSREEQWALRLVNMLVCLRILLSEGIMREIPVFGILQGQVITGIIDEVRIRTQPSQPLSTPEKHLTTSNSSRILKKARRMPSPSGSRVIEYPPGSSSTADPPPDHITLSSIMSSSHQNILHLIDTKTRRLNSLPSHEDTISSRIQLMLYRRLLVELVSASRPFDFVSLWERLGLKSSKIFSTRFLVQAGLITKDDTPATACLDHLAKEWVTLVQQSNISEVATDLTIVYRLQPATPHRKRKSDIKSERQGIITDLYISREDRDLARAIEASLNDLRGAQENRETDKEKIGIENAANIIPPDGQDLKGSSDHLRTPTTASTSTSASPIASGDIIVNDMTIIGTKEFIYDEIFLDGYLVHMLHWWHGTRKPEGVSLQNSRRCFSCEYASNCEWREQKAIEFREHKINT